MTLTAALPTSSPTPLPSILQSFRLEGVARSVPEASSPGDFRLIEMPSHRGWPVALCEAEVGRPFPSYATRRAWRSFLPDPYATGLLLFSDAANSTFVWTWRYRYPTGHTQYVEIDGNVRMDSLRTALDRLPAFGVAADGAGEIDKSVEMLVYELTRHRPPALLPASGDCFEDSLRRIEECDDPDWLRSIWRKLRNVSVLHTDCADGQRLLMTAGTLEIAFIAVIERMRGFLADACLLGERRRPEHLRDMRILSEDAEDRRWDFDSRVFVRRLLVQQNLYAVARSRVAGRKVVRDLLGFSGLHEGALPSLDCNVWRLREGSKASTPDIRNRPSSQRNLRRPEGEGDASNPETCLGTGHVPLSEALELHRKAWEMVRRVRLAGGHAGDLRRAASQLERRRSLIRTQLTRMASGADGVTTQDVMFCRPPQGRPLSVIIE